MSKKQLSVGTRNVQIVNKLLNGSTVSELAKEYSLSPVSIRAIRSKANASGGLGDVVEDVLHSKPLEKVTNFVKGLIWKEGEDCGCDERKEKLNKAFPHLIQPKCMTEEMYKAFSLIRGKRQLRSDERVEVAVQHAHLFNHKYSLPCKCSPKRYIDWIADIEKVWQSYQ